MCVDSVMTQFLCKQNKLNELTRRTGFLTVVATFPSQLLKICRADSINRWKKSCRATLSLSGRSGAAIKRWIFAQSASGGCKAPRPPREHKNVIFYARQVRVGPAQEMQKNQTAQVNSVNFTVLVRMFGACTVGRLNCVFLVLRLMLMVPKHEL